MRILGVGDIHARKHRPRFRIGDFWAQFCDKIDFVRYTAIEKRVCAVCLPGDVFDSAVVPYSVTRYMMEFLLKLKEAGIEVFSVTGQHDQHNHRRRLENTPYGVLVASGATVHLTGLEPVRRQYGGHSVHFYGAGWKEEVPEPIEQDAINILLTHKMIIGGFRLWPGQEQFITGRNFLRLHKYDFVIAGDNHKRFEAEFKGRYLCNAGSFVRLKIDQAEHLPHVFLYDFDDRRPEWIAVPIVPWEEIVNRQYSEAKEASVQLRKFVESIAKLGRQSSKVIFKERLLETAKKTGKSSIIKEIKGILAEVEK